MYCKYCGKEISTHAEICPHCGARVQYSVKSTLDRLLELKTIKEEKSPTLAAALGFLLGWIGLGPLGYVYLGQWNWFWVTLIAYFVLLIPSLGLVLPFYPFLLAFHQYYMAKELNERLPGEATTDAEPDDEGAASSGAGIEDAEVEEVGHSESREPPTGAPAETDPPD